MERLGGAGQRLTPEPVARIDQQLDRLRLGIRDPELAHTVPRIELRLRDSVPALRRRRQDFDDEVRSGGDELLPDDRLPFGGNEQNIRLNDVGFGEDDIAGSEKDQAEPVLSNEIVDQPSDTFRYELVVRRRSRRHEQVSVDHLVAAILRQQQVILVRETQGC